MGTLREQVIREMANLGPAELVAVQGLLDAFKRREPVTAKQNNGGRSQARTALTSIKGSLANTISVEREDRV